MLRGLCRAARRAFLARPTSLVRARTSEIAIDSLAYACVLDGYRLGEVRHGGTSPNQPDYFSSGSICACACFSASAADCLPSSADSSALPMAVSICG